MKKTFNLVRVTLLAGVLVLSVMAATGFAAQSEGGSCKKPKDSQCLAGSYALGDWTPSLQ